MMAQTGSSVSTKDFRIAPRALLFDPQFHVFDYVPESGLSRFLVVEERNLEAAPFIDIRFEPLAQGQFSVSTRELLSLEKMHGQKRPEAAFIFHHAFVCSTLLARCLNQIDAFFSLKEPWILRRLGDLKRLQQVRGPLENWPEVFTCHLSLLCKNYHTGRVPVIKVTNVASNLAEDVLTCLPGRKLLYLYSDLESFLISNLKKPAETQRKMPDLATAFLREGNLASRFPKYCDVKNLPFLHICALVWLVSLYNFQQTTKNADPAVFTMLDMHDLLGDMGGTLEQVSGFFGHAAQPMEIKRMMDPRVTRTDAKHQNLPYGVDSKQRETEQVLRKHQADIAQTLEWIAPLVERLGIVEYASTHQLGS
jgi:hypothetical protein